MRVLFLSLIVLAGFSGCMDKKVKIYSKKEWYQAGYLGNVDKNGKHVLSMVDSALRVSGNYPAWAHDKKGHIDSNNAEAIVDTGVVWYFRYNTSDTQRDEKHRPIFDSAIKQYKFVRAMSQPQVDSLVKPLVYYGPDTTNH